MATYWSGEMSLPAQSTNSMEQTIAEDPTAIARGRALFLKNCAHCHGDDASGSEEGPNLRKRRRSAMRIDSVVRNGIKGEMPRFGEKLHDADVQLLIEFLHSIQPAPRQ